MLIGITGKAGAGKDTIADFLWQHYSFVRIAFADPLKRATQQIFGLTDEQTWARELKEVEIPFWGMSPRRMMQLVGTEAMQPLFGRDVWVKRWLMSFDLVKDTDHVVVPDVRFPQEAEKIRELGGFIINVIRDSDSGLEDSAKAHVSEAGLPISMLDAVIYNNGTIEDLCLEVNSFVKARS